MVSVDMITYNHEPYIAQAIEGVLMQKTNFKFELVIGEDCSTDRTREICIEYQKKYPEIIKLLLPEKNLGVVKNGDRTIKACTGKYIALCEGDDYWTDPLKLQKQVDFMEANNDYSMCFHNAYVINKRTNEKKLFNEKKIKSTITPRDVILKPWFTPTASFLFRKEGYPLDALWSDVNGDMQLLFINSTLGKIHYMDEVMSVYNLFSSNTSLSNRLYLNYKTMYQKKINLLNEFDKFTRNRYKIYTTVKRAGIYIRILQKRLFTVM
ncbi:MAG: glycosyltransferase [Neisseria sp.]|nr:glycosyltransferase [Neisseria sp.]